MANRTIPQRELRNHIGEVLREAEAGTEFTITVRGRPVARLGPPREPDRPRINVPGAALRAKLAETPVDTEFAADVKRLRELEAAVEDPWPGSDPSAA
jgi:prevent-host-death family protein